MNTIIYKITFLSYWAVGSGKGGGLAADNLVLKEKGLPIIPGKTLKGLIRQVYREVDPENIIRLFGHEKKTNDNEKSLPNKLGKFHFGSARLPENLRLDLIGNHALQRELYHSRTSTAIETGTKQALENSLRKMEVCVPLTLNAEIEIQDDSNFDLEFFKKALKGVRHLGEKRYRGLGRCHLEFIQLKTEKANV
ncbi:CRISPR/Cas system CSM-associated protein Csm3, group 7 of RAMP superfamily [Spirosomataceae bacterium TFI 002]|nr:CRISPR/Cas system CSM-associated protein Csm3, group 7 of RAMP superfamily [Spirosomataceae bacterium TFI 002]